MLTDIFADRYQNFPLFKHYSRREKRLFHQLFTLLEELNPYWETEKSARKNSKLFWETIHKKVGNELGVRWLATHLYDVNVGLGEYQRTERRTRSEIEICRIFINTALSKDDNVDETLKERISLIEVGMRQTYDAINLQEERSHEKSPIKSYLDESLKLRKSQYITASEELNVRFQQAMIPLHYHNGFIQILKDDKISAEIEQPFWSLVSEELWQNVDLDMKEAIDQRDTGGKDPALFAAKALESTIKIVSDELRTSRGNEKGAHNYIDNLASKKTAFLSQWEGEIVKLFFTKVRNPLGHGPGKEPMPTLTLQQSSWAIETAMSFIKLIVSRFDDVQANVK